MVKKARVRERAALATEVRLAANPRREEARPAVTDTPPVSRWSRPSGDAVIGWIETHCYVPEGRLVGQPVRLRAFQKREIRKIYDNPAGTRRGIWSMGRKNAKTATAAFLLLCHTAGVAAIPNSQLYSAAQSKEQAAILFALAAKVVRMSPTLSVVIVVRDTVKELLCPELGTKYRALSAEASTAYGLGPVFVVHDELGQVRGPHSELYEALETASGAQEEPLSIIISTQAPTDADLLSILIDDALAGHDPRVTVSLYTAPMEDDPFVIDTIRKANPALGEFLNEREVLGMADDARRMPSREANFRNLVLNQRVEAANSFVSPAVWRACGQPPRSLHGLDVYGGLDLSAVNDLTACVLTADDGEAVHVRPTFWLPEQGLLDRSHNDRVPYDVWAREGFIETCPGNSIRYEFVARWLKDRFDELNIVKIGFDRWNMRHLKPKLIDVGFTDQMIEEHFVEFGQGTQSMSPALRELESDILDARLRHGNHPVLTMCAANSVVEGRPGEKADEANRKLSKKRSRGRIDGMVALAMARGVAPQRAAPALDVAAMIG